MQPKIRWRYLGTPRTTRSNAPDAFFEHRTPKRPEASAQLGTLLLLSGAPRRDSLFCGFDWPQPVVPFLTLSFVVARLPNDKKNGPPENSWYQLILTSQDLDGGLKLKGSFGANEKGSP